MSPFAAKLYLCLLAFVFGAVVGSFLNVVIWRLPRGEYLSYPGSHCPKCNHKIRPWENIPILSWLFLGGKCSSCHLPISWRYPAGEAATGLLYFWIFLHILNVEHPLETVPGAFWLAGSALAAGIIDAEHKFIPNKITYSGIIAAFFMAIALPSGRFALDAAAATHTDILLSSVIKLLQRITGEDFCTSTVIISWLDCLLGFIVGGGILGLLSLVGGFFAKNHSSQLKKPAETVITQDTLTIKDTWQAKWEEVITSTKAVMTLQAELKSGWKALPGGTKGPLRITAEGISLNGQKLQWEDLKEVRLLVSGWSCPFQLLGLGDVKFMAMTGAFLGADAAIYILFAGAVLGAIFGFIKILFSLSGFSKKQISTAAYMEIPFGPFLAIPTLLWLLFFA